ncbi:hypothetical protein BC826DRAFT_967253 [Russula brevipes]|nr:hypothetical protein BC826DRAFT_967253 [Russula brevipes]
MAELQHLNDASFPLLTGSPSDNRCTSFPSWPDCKWALQRTVGSSRTPSPKGKDTIGLDHDGTQVKTESSSTSTRWPLNLLSRFALRAYSMGKSEGEYVELPPDEGALRLCWTRPVCARLFAAIPAPVTPVGHEEHSSSTSTDTLEPLHDDAAFAGGTTPHDGREALLASKVGVVVWQPLAHLLNTGIPPVNIIMGGDSAGGGLN